MIIINDNKLLIDKLLDNQVLVCEYRRRIAKLLDCNKEVEYLTYEKYKVVLESRDYNSNIGKFLFKECKIIEFVTKL